MVVERLGETAAILRDLPGDAAQVTAAIEAASLPGVVETVACYDTVGVYFLPGFDPSSLVGLDLPLSRAVTKAHVIPVCYELGDDLAEVASKLSLTPEEVIAIHTRADFHCYAIGFCPGFPYLGYLPEEFSRVSRRAIPRTRVEAGSVAIAGRQTGIYPLDRPGGWSVLGRTPLTLVDVDERYFPISAGDTIRFQAIGLDEFRVMRGDRLGTRS